MQEETHFGYSTIKTSEKTARVAEVFDSVANRYDVMNDVMSFGVHRLWKDWYVWQCAPKADEVCLDLAAGSGDISRRIAKRIKTGKLVVSDINESMLMVGRKRLIDWGFLQNLEFAIINAEEIPFADNTFDLITMSFGLRNVTNQAQALSEMFRVLKPKGRLLILEFSQPTNEKFSRIYDWYSFNFLPKMGEIIAADRESYQYLAESIRMHPNQETLKMMFEDAGFINCEYQNLTGGICAIHKGIKP